MRSVSTRFIVVVVGERIIERDLAVFGVRAGGTILHSVGRVVEEGGIHVYATIADADENATARCGEGDGR